MKAKVETKFRESRYGFRAGRGTVDAIFIVCQIIEKAKEKLTFDNVWRTALWKMLKVSGVEHRIVNILKYKMTIHNVL